MSIAFDFATPQHAVKSMLIAGAVFTVRRREDGLGMSFTYRVADGGDLSGCRAILEAVKSRPPAFYEAFRAAAQEAVKLAERGAA